VIALRQRRRDEDRLRAGKRQRPDALRKLDVEADKQADLYPRAEQPRQVAEAGDEPKTSAAIATNSTLTAAIVGV
jgi:hypothetical protein